MRKVTVEELMTLFTQTLSDMKPGLFNENDQAIEHAVFEEFDIGVHSFMHVESLDRLLSAGLITTEIKSKCLDLRNLVVMMQKEGVWNLDSFKNDPVWKDLINRVVEIKMSIESA